MAYKTFSDNHINSAKGWRTIGGKRIYFRSKMEANYARYLEWQKQNGQIKEWKHEPKTYYFDGVRRGNVSYLPDFGVVELDDSVTIHEVKGWMNPDSKTKLKRMAKYFPNIQIVLITKKEFKMRTKNLDCIIEGWES